MTAVLSLWKGRVERPQPAPRMADIAEAVALRAGLTIEEISQLLSSLPERRTPTKRDWTRISTAFRHMLDERIALMERTRRKLDGCIGCGCLSLKKCQLYNPEDRARGLGTGPRFLLEDVSVVSTET